ncbi:KAP family P-loop NTPase fold protein [Segatella paludivivens]|uniref:KAP family P-loop NTPase fold protein n=1 Tax=Segatella paludivivens TaxID=185294 RepID=UPI0003619404|nr:P-loop NTPase fold protein [Segatella paludivivens]
MEFLKKTWGFIEEKMFLTTIIVTLIISVIVFKAFWVHLITIIWVSPIMSKLYGHELLIASFYGAIIALYYYRKFKFTQYYNNNRVWYFVLLFLIYIICFSSKEWNFSLITYKTYSFAWTNLIFLVFIPEIGLYLNCIKRKKIKYNPLLEIEETKKTGDEYNRNGCCESVYKVINTCFFEKQSFAVGISGSWGSGKTTYINMLKQRYEKDCKDGKNINNVQNEQINKSNEAISIIDFEPWKDDNPRLIIKSFFALLKSELKPYLSNISIPIDQYVSSLLDCDVPIKWKFFLNTIHFLSVANKKSPYEQITFYIKKSKHRVVVFIDDIDRLDKDEIKEVLRLIRNTANFPYIQFIVAYDKDYIISTLKDSGIESPTNYLEKFFNLEITLPKYENRIVCSELEERLSKDMNDLGFKGLDKIIHDMIYYMRENNNDKVNMYLVPCVLTNIRDVIRYRNSFYISMQMIKDLQIENEIEIADMFYIELLRYRYNDVYMFLRNKPASILISENEYTFNYNSESLKNITSTYSVYDQDIIKDIFDKLFRHSNDRHSLNKKRYFVNYFMYRLDNKIFTKMDFLSLSGLSDVELSSRVNNLYEEKYKNEFESQIYEILSNIYTVYPFKGGSISNVPDYKIIYDILKSILKCKEIKNDELKKEICNPIMIYLLELPFYDANHLKAMLDLYNYLDLTVYTDNSFTDSLLSKILYTDNLLVKPHSNIHDFYEIIFNFLAKVNDVVRMSNAITKFLEDFTKGNIFANKLVIDVPTIDKIRLDYFIHYNDKLSDNGFVLFSNCIDSKNTFTSKRLLQKDALAYMKKEIEADPERYFYNFIQKGSSTGNKNMLYPEPYYLDIFGSNDEFDKFIQKCEGIPSYVRMHRFWTLYKYLHYQPLLFASNINLDSVLANNFQNEWNSLLELLKLMDKYDNKEISEDEFKKAVDLFESSLQ